MNAAARAGLVGAVVGLVQFVILYWRRDDIGSLDAMALIVLPYGLGFFLSWWGRLPRWWGVATMGPAITAVFLLANIFVLRIPEITDLGDWQTALCLMALGATAYLAAGGIFMPVHWGLRGLLIAGVAAVYLAVWSAPDVIADAARANRLSRAEVPLIAPTLPDHRLVYLDYVGGRLELSYEGQDDRSRVDVSVGPESTASLKAACRKSDPWDDIQEYEKCRRVPPGVWLRSGEYGKIIFATYGDALVRIESPTMSEKELIAVLDTFHPVEAEELARLDEG
ncbi:hypothetical protein [Nonomuraea guangzhouensis]|uniref:Uncharacterized protein n=1 Tax=Nonomuraea guangzhouensis TaxID=1291555 RepID=A0ABW4GM51_9ACTN|nr:hypothetical protein [Nonomuraea guangzhouensis]